jgi:glutaconyl-CoA decarboxylase
MKYKIRLNGKVFEVEAEKGEAQLLSEYDDIGTPAASPRNKESDTAAPAPASAAAAVQKASAGGKSVCAPLPGTVVAVRVQTGQQVKKGEAVAVIESMKMENDIVATESGTVTAVHVARGAQVQAGEPIISLS